MRKSHTDESNQFKSEILAMLTSLMFVSAMVTGCPNVADNQTVGVQINLPNHGSEQVSIEAYVSPRAFEAMKSQQSGAYEISLVNGCVAVDPDFGEDGEATEVFDTFAGWEVLADVRTKLLMLELGFATNSEPFILEYVHEGKYAGCQWERDKDGSVNLYCPVK